MSDQEPRVQEVEPTADASIQEAEAAVQDDNDVAKIARERDDYLDALKRLQADFENYKKRILKQQTEHLERAAEALVEKLLPVLDTFDLAIAHGGDGLDQVQGQLMAALEKEGLERIDPVGKPFDPNESDAVAHEDGEGDPVVSEVMRTGYRFKGKLLRPAMVKVKG
jgi:molecular chaperone GrpE